MDAVRNAMSGPFALRFAGPGLHVRVLRAGTESAPALVCCLVLGLLIARELRRPAPGPGGVVGARRGVLALLAATAATVAGAAWLLAVTIPRLEEWLAEGLGATIDPTNAALVVLGFAGLALGPVARASDRPGQIGPDAADGRPRLPWAGLLLKLAVVVVLLHVIVARGLEIAGRFAESSVRWIDRLNAALEWVGSLVLIRPWAFFESPEWLVLALAQAWVAWRVARLLVAPIVDEPAPIDASLGDRRALGRFATRWGALTVLMVASLPAMFVAGLALLDALFRALG
jgi:hypothetical protein